MSISIEPRGDPAPMVDTGVEPSEHVRLVERHLDAEFSGRLNAGDIHRVASEAVARFDGVPVRTFVPILAIRTARELARAELTSGRDP